MEFALALGPKRHELEEQSLKTRGKTPHSHIMRLGGGQTRRRSPWENTTGCSATQPFALARNKPYYKKHNAHQSLTTLVKQGDEVLADDRMQIEDIQTNVSSRNAAGAPGNTIDV